MVNYLVLFERLIACVLEKSVCPSFLVANFGHFADLLHQVVHIEHKHHLALSEASLHELIRRKGHPILEEIDEHLGELFDELSFWQELEFAVHLVGPQIVAESGARFKGQVLDDVPEGRRASLLQQRLKVFRPTRFLLALSLALALRCLGILVHWLGGGVRESAAEVVRFVEDLVDLVHVMDNFAHCVPGLQAVVGVQTCLRNCGLFEIDGFLAHLIHLGGVERFWLQALQRHMSES